MCHTPRGHRDGAEGGKLYLAGLHVEMATVGVAAFRAPRGLEARETRLFEFFREESNEIHPVRRIVPIRVVRHCDASQIVVRLYDVEAERVLVPLQKDGLDRVGNPVLY